ncbi:protein tyrosine phosphatase family protein [soil metagenome]
MADKEPISDPTDIFMWRRINDWLTSSGQPTEDQLGVIKTLAITHIVNLGLHTHEQALADEAASVRALDMHYIHIPVAFDRPTQEDFDAFGAIMQALQGQTIHVHCIANLRVSAFLYRYRREHGHVSQGEAAEEMERVWKPGGVWASFIGRDQDNGLPHHYAGRDY